MRCSSEPLQLGPLSKKGKVRYACPLTKEPSAPVKSVCKFYGKWGHKEHDMIVTAPWGKNPSSLHTTLASLSVQS